MRVKNPLTPAAMQRAWDGNTPVSASVLSAEGEQEYLFLIEEEPVANQRLCTYTGTGCKAQAGKPVGEWQPAMVTLVRSAESAELYSVQLAVNVPSPL